MPDYRTQLPTPSIVSGEKSNLDNLRDESLLSVVNTRIRLHYSEKQTIQLMNSLMQLIAIL